MIENILMLNNSVKNKININNIIDVLAKDTADIDLLNQKEYDFIEKSGDKIYSIILEYLIGQKYDIMKAKKHWTSLLNHKNSLEQTLNRKINIRLTAMDYFSDITGDINQPTILESNQYLQLIKTLCMDSLTNLPARNYGEILLQKCFKTMVKRKSPFSIAILDIDNLSKVNYFWGYNEGNEVIKQVSHIIKQNIGRKNICIRQNDEEFLVILKMMNKSQALHLLEKIRKNVRKSLKKYNITISGGVSSFPMTSRRKNELIEHAYNALKIAKNKGNNSIISSIYERRSDIRIKGSFPVKIKTFTLLPVYEKHVTVDISKSGFAYTDSRPSKTAKEISGKIYIKDKPKKFRGEIVHVNPHNDNKYNIGVKFIDY